MTGSRRLGLAAASVILFWAAPATAHEGPPFPIVVDRVVGSWTVSVWTDPDIGTGTFFVIVERTDGGGPVSDDVDVTVAVRPTSGRLPEVSYRAERQRDGRRTHFLAEVEFDQGEWWEVRVALEGGGGGGEVLAEVEATPDGVIGPIGLLVYLLPFLAIGFLWVKAAMVRRSQHATGTA